MHMTSNKVNFNKRKTVSFFLKSFFLLVMPITLSQKNLLIRNKPKLNWVLQNDDL